MEILQDIAADVKEQIDLATMELLMEIFATIAEGSDSVSSKATKPLSEAIGKAVGNEAVYRTALESYFIRKDALTLPSLLEVFSAAKKKAKMSKMGGATAGTVHSFSEDEKKGYVDFVNARLSDDEDLKEHLPIQALGNDLFKLCADTVLLVKMLCLGFPEAVDRKALTLKPSNKFQQSENLNQCIRGAKQIGCSVVNIGAGDILAGTPHLIMGLTWQIIKKILMKQVQESLAHEMKASDHDLDEINANLPPEQILFKWINGHLASAGIDKTVNNWSTDFSDSFVLSHLMHCLEPGVVSSGDVTECLAEENLTERAEQMLQLSDKLGCRKFATAVEIAKGNPRLTLAFVATMFSAYPHFALSSIVKVEELEEKLKVAEERATQLDSTKEQLDEVSQRLNEEREARAQLAQKQTELSETIEKVTREKTEKVTLLEDLSTARATLEAKIGVLEAEKVALVAELASAKEEAARLGECLSGTQAELTAALAAAEATKKALEDELAALKESSEAEIAALKASLAESEALVVGLQEEVAELKTTVAMRDERVAGLEADKAALIAERDQLAASLEAEQLAHNETKATLGGKIEGLEGEVAEKEGVIEDWERKHAEAVATIGERDGTISRLESELELERATVADLREELADVHAELQDTVELKDAEIAAQQAEIAGLREEVEDWKRKYLQLEAESKAAAEAAAAEIADLQARLREEIQAKELLEEELADTQEELEEFREESDDEKTLLLQRIKDLEEELDQLRALMAESLDQAAVEKAQALQDAMSAKQQALAELERQREEDLRKVSDMLAAVTKEGYLLKQGSGFGARWNKRYFVLKGAALLFYMNEKAYKETSNKPRGIIQLEGTRLYDVEESKKQFAFMLEGSGMRHNLAALALEDANSWKNAIKEAKKKALAQNVIAKKQIQ